MPPAANRDVFVILYDLKVKNRSSALHTLSQIILYEELSQSKNQYKLYLVNAAETDNNLKHKGILKKDALIDAGSLIENILNVQQGKSDFLEALEVAVDELKEWFQKSGVATLQIVFITDLDTFESVIPSEQLISNISSMSIFLYIIGPEIFPPKTIMCHDDISKWMKTFEANKLKGNLEVASSIVKSTPYSVICHYSLGMHLFHSYKFCNGKQAWQVPLSFGSILHLQVSTMKYCEAGMPFRLKNNLITERNQKWVYVDDPEKCIDIRDTVKGIVKHGKFVKIEDDARFKSYGPRSFQILLITEAKNVPEHSFQNENSYIVLPNQQQSEEYLQFINTFIDQLAEENKYIIARRVYNKDYNPMFVVLIPRPDFNIKGFILTQLPYADDILQEYFEQDINIAPKVDIDKNLIHFMESIDITNDKCQIQVPIGPRMMINLNALGIIDLAQEKMIQEKLSSRKLYEASTSFDKLAKEWPKREIELKEEGNEETQSWPEPDDDDLDLLL